MHTGKQGKYSRMVFFYEVPVLLYMANGDY